jgi:hypothetical protein
LIVHQNFLIYAIIINPGRFQINENMKPMELISTQFITFREIKVEEIDLIEDAWGINSEFCDVIDLLREIEPIPERCLTTNLIKKIRKIV